jgi:hypothetical protein
MPPQVLVGGLPLVMGRPLEIDGMDKALIRNVF